MTLSTLNSTDNRPLFLGVTLASMMLLQVVGQGGQAYIQISALIVLLTSFFIVVSYPVTNRVPIIMWFLTLFFSLIIIVGAFRSADIIGFSVVIRSIGVVGFIFLGLMFAQRRDYSVLERAFPIYTLFFAGVLVYVLIDDDRLFARLQGHLHPNLWAFVTGASAIGILYLKASVFLRALLICVYFYFLAFEFQARGPLLYAAIATAFVVVARVFLMIKEAKRNYLLLSFLAICLSSVAIFSIFAADYLLNEILLINHQNRGLGSGFTGRTEIWSLLLTFLSEKPFIGYGMDMSRYYVTNYISAELGGGDAQSAHNSYISVMFDFGFLGLLVYVFFIFLMLLGAGRRRNFQFLAFLILYLLMGMTEARPLNVGNPPSILFMLLITYCAAGAFSDSRRRIFSATKRRGSNPLVHV